MAKHISHDDSPRPIGIDLPATWVSVASITLGTTQLQVFRALSTQPASGSVTLTIPGSAKATAVCATFSGVNTTGTNGSGAIDAIDPATGSSSNPSNSITTLTNKALVVSFLGTGDATVATEAGYTDVVASTANSGGGTTKSTTNLLVHRSTTLTARAVPHSFTWGNSNDWVMYSIAIKP